MNFDTYYYILGNKVIPNGWYRGTLYYNNVPRIYYNNILRIRPMGRDIDKSNKKDSYVLLGEENIKLHLQGNYYYLIEVKRKITYREYIRDTVNEKNIRGKDTMNQVPNPRPIEDITIDEYGTLKLNHLAYSYFYIPKSNKYKIYGWVKSYMGFCASDGIVLPINSATFSYKDFIKNIIHDRIVKYKESINDK
jgi:hypothetical protein